MLALPSPGKAAVIIDGIPGIEIDRLVIVCDRLLMVASFSPDKATIGVGFGTLRVKANRLVKVLYSILILA